MSHTNKNVLSRTSVRILVGISFALLLNCSSKKESAVASTKNEKVATEETTKLNMTGANQGDNCFILGVDRSTGTATPPIPGYLKRTTTYHERELECSGACPFSPPNIVKYKDRTVTFSCVDSDPSSGDLPTESGPIEYDFQNGSMAVQNIYKCSNENSSPEECSYSPYVLGTAETPVYVEQKVLCEGYASPAENSSGGSAGCTYHGQ